VRVDRAQLAAQTAQYLDAGWRFGMLVGLDERRSEDGDPGFAVEVVLHRPGQDVVRLRADLPAVDPRYPSVGRMVPAALWDEREAFDLLGIVADGHPDPRPLVLHEAYPSGFHPLRHDSPPEPPDGPFDREYVPVTGSGTGVYELPVGPIHAGVIEPGHFRFTVVGESILHLDARLFYTHRGVERLVQGRPVEQARAVIERACGVCTVTHGLAYAMAVERVAGVTVPRRAQVLRAVLAELERLYNHVGDLGNLCAGVGFNPGSSQLGWLKERLLRINESVTGHRYLTGAVAPGGLAVPPTEAALADLPRRLGEIEQDLHRLLHVVSRAEAVQDRFRGAGRVSRDLAIRLGATGVTARASGIATDLRRDLPTGAYVDLAVPVVESAGGDVAARFHVRAQEAIGSLDLLRELLASVPDGPDRAPVDDVPAGSALGWAEGPRGASWLWLRVGSSGTVERLHLRSASFANWPVVAAAVPDNLVPDFPLINKSFELCYACTDR
jgi:Ni,Fe-hydrogenase III large subunit/Ni,Fe-hydrogenase III component G